MSKKYFFMGHLWIFLQNLLAQASCIRQNAQMLVRKDNCTLPWTWSILGFEKSSKHFVKCEENQFIKHRDFPVWKYLINVPSEDCKRKIICIIALYVRWSFSWTLTLTYNTFHMRTSLQIVKHQYPEKKYFLNGSVFIRVWLSWGFNIEGIGLLYINFQIYFFCYIDYKKAYFKAFLFH